MPWWVLLSLPMPWSCSMAVCPSSLWVPQKQWCIHACFLQLSKMVTEQNKNLIFKILGWKASEISSCYIIDLALKRKQPSNTDQNFFFFFLNKHYGSWQQQRLCYSGACSFSPNHSDLLSFGLVLTTLLQVLDFIYTLLSDLHFSPFLAKSFLSSSRMEAPWKPRTMSVYVHLGSSSVWQGSWPVCQNPFC